MAELIILYARWLAQKHETLPLSLPAASEWHKKNLPKEILLAPFPPLPPSCLLGGTGRISLGNSSCALSTLFCRSTKEKIYKLFFIKAKPFIDDNLY